MPCPYEDDSEFRLAATFHLVRGLANPRGVSLRTHESPPRYIVERLPPLTPTSGTSASLSASLADLPQVFRITARGVGLRSSTVVVLQSTYIKR